MTISAKYEAKRDHILAKGIMVLWEKGYNGTSVKDIVDAAGVPKGSFYNYFESKEDFAVKALEKYFNEFLAEGFAILDDTTKSPRERLIALYEKRVDMMLNHPDFENGCIACTLGNEMSKHSEAIRQAITAKESFVNGKIINAVREAQQAGEIKNTLDAEILVNFIEDAWKGAIITCKEFQNDQSMRNMLLVTKNMLT